MHPAIRDNLIAMLDTLAGRLGSKEISDEEYSMTLNYLRFRIGEDLFDRYASPLARETAARLQVP
jgi:hypothetical protein